MEYKPFYCPTEKLPRSFLKIDDGMAIIGEYKCEGCGNNYGEAQLAYPDGEGGNLVKLLQDKGIKLGELNGR